MSQAEVLSFVHQIKHNSQLSGLDFSVNTTLGTLLLLNVLNIVNFYKCLRVLEKEMETVETVSDFILGGSKITADGDCSHEIKRHLLLGRKLVTKLDTILRNIDITLPSKVCLVKAMVFPRIMYGCESWTIKKAEHQRIDAFELWCWRVPWTASS